MSSMGCLEVHFWKKKYRAPLQRLRPWRRQVHLMREKGRRPKLGQRERRRQRWLQVYLLQEKYRPPLQRLRPWRRQVHLMGEKGRRPKQRQRDRLSKGGGRCTC